MDYKGFLICHDKVCGGWYVKVSVWEEWLASSEKDAKRQVDEYLSRKARRNAA